MSDAILTLSDITSGYGSAAVVRDVSLDIKQGEICSLLTLHLKWATTPVPV
jgi:ABC-type Fe3+/spermidine/putrescine transport system ATPase subunit